MTEPIKPTWNVDQSGSTPKRSPKRSKSFCAFCIFNPAEYHTRGEYPFNLDSDDDSDEISDSSSDDEGCTTTITPKPLKGKKPRKRTVVLDCESDDSDFASDDEVDKRKHTPTKKHLKRTFVADCESDDDRTPTKKYLKADKALRRDSGNGNADIVSLLLANGADCLRNGHKDVVDLLLANGANVLAREDDALRWASTKGHADVVSLLLVNGADVHAGGDDALRSASVSGHADIVSLLLENGADVHAEEDDALRWVSAKGHADIVSLLLENGRAPLRPGEVPMDPGPYPFSTDGTRCQPYHGYRTTPGTGLGITS
ncbi:ankyrin repeat-containing domain protein [Gaertneriomyces semiglobifer]|nr:ankyrin repeat-containing domain protein [Gaertneriomyces semiglobifer]